jgi:phenylacetate-CoA ligase
VHCELNPADAASADRAAIGEWVQHRVKTLIGISTRVVVHAPNEMERTQTGKARRVIDTRPR